jgi:DNA-binding winged helix-turn-helix (wHTH) protein
MPVQQRLLLIFARHPQRTLSRSFLQSELWSDPLQRPPDPAKALSLAVHRLRQIFADGPLASDVVKAVYGKGYCLDLPVYSLPSSPVDIRHDEGESLTICSDSAAGKERQLSRLYYNEVHDHWPRRDPYELDHRRFLLKQCVAHDPAFLQAYFDLCYFSLLQCLWGVRSAASVLPEIQDCLAKVDSLSGLSPVWSAIRAEVLTMLLWQPRDSVRLYGEWLANSLPPGLPLFSWARHLIFSGRPHLAVRVLKAYVHQDLRQGWLVLSLAYAAIGKVEDAIQAAHSQLSIDRTLVGSRLFLAMLVAFCGDGDAATRLVASTGILERPFQGSLALVSYALAHGPMRLKAHQLLDEALAVNKLDPDKAGAAGYWGLAALALERPADAFPLLTLTVRRRCYSAPVLLAMPFLNPYRREPAYSFFHAQMLTAFRLAPGAG